MKNSGFTLLEILLTVAAIAILAGIVVVAINPAKQFATLRNAQRKVDINTLLNAIYQYSVDNNGGIPPGIVAGGDCTTDSSNVCTPGYDGCTSYSDLTPLVTNRRYLVELPTDPQAASPETNIDYHVTYDEYGTVIVCAPRAELGETIRVMR